MKKIRILTSILVTMALATSLVGCKAKTTTNPSETTKPVLKDPNITILRPDVKRDDNSPFAKAIKQFEDQYGGKVTIADSNWSNMTMKTIAAMAAGSAIDALFSGTPWMPTYVVKGYLQPIDKYVDLKSPSLGLPIMDADYKFNGKYYLATTKTNGMAWMIYYNKTMFENNGVKTPGDYYKEGKWNYDTLKQLAMQFTKDTNGDGKLDQWGVGSWWSMGWAYGNGAGLLNVDSNGKVSQNLGDPKVVAGLQFFQDGYSKDKWLMNNSADQAFFDKKIPMYVERDFWGYTEIEKRKDTFKDDWDMVPFPYGPGNDKQVNIVESDGWGIGAGCKNPEGAGKFLDILMKTLNDDGEQANKAKRPEHIKLVDDMKKNSTAYCQGPFDKVWDFMGEISGATPVSTTLEKYKPVVTAVADDTNKDFVKPQPKPFNGVAKVDFDKNDGGVKDPGAKEVKVSVTSDANEVIDGKSLKYSADSAVEWPAGITFDITKLAVPGWHTYTIKFDYKLLKDAPKDNSEICFKWVDKNGVSVGWATKAMKDLGGKSGKFELTVDGPSDDKNDYTLYIQQHWGTDLVIDNLEIVEKK